MKTVLQSLVSIAGTFLVMAFNAGATAPEPGHSPSWPVTGPTIRGTNTLTIPAKGATGTVSLRLGERNPLVPPFKEIFDDFSQGMEHLEFQRHFEVIDANGDGRSWGLYNYSDSIYSKCAYLLYPLEDGNLSDVPGRAKADDWLVSKAIKLEGGKFYNVSMDASLFVDGTEHLVEVRMGEYNDADGLTTLVIPATTVTTRARKLINGWFEAPGDGLYYIGVHAISERAKCAPGYLFIDNIAMDAPRTGGEPGDVSSLTFTNDPNGSTSVDISFNLPATSINGSALSGTVDITVTRNGNTIATLNGKKPGEKISLKDDPMAEGATAYSFIVSNSIGAGREYRTSHYAGIAEPESPIITSVTEVAEGRVTITWTAPERDVNGNAINSSLLRYDIFDYSTEIADYIAYDVKGTSCTVDVPLHHGGQTAALLVMTAALNGKVSAPTGSDVIIVGKPYGFPYHYSFVESSTEESVLMSDSDDEVTWRLLDDLSDPQSQDYDNGYISMIGNQPDLKGEFSTGKIDLTEATHPYVSIYTYVYPDDENVIVISVIDCATGEKTAVSTINLTDYPRVGWNRLLVPITEFAGKVVRVCFGCRIETHGYIPFDNLSISDLQDTDLSVDLISASQYASVDEKYSVTASVMNTGHKTVDNYEVKLYCDGKCVDTVASDKPLASMQEASVTLSGRFSSASSEMPEFYVEVETAGDSDPDNDRTRTFSITFLAPNHPTVTTLTAQETDSEVHLTWTAPDLTKAAPEESIEDFESYAAFTTELNGGWTMHDGDNGYVRGYNGVEMPVDMTQQAWWTMTNDAPFNFLPTFGKSSLVQMCSVNANGSAVKNDDWLISPELYGGRQTIGFRARSASVSYGYDTFEVYYSLTDNNPESFNLIMLETSLDEIWQQFFVSLPDGAKYFAIRCTSDDCFSMMLDDITYTSKGTPREYRLEGYNVYRNGTMLNSTPLTECSFVTTRELERDAYFVTAVYDRGESVASNVAYLGKSGLDEVTEINDAPVEYFDLRGIRVPANALRSGIYIRKQGGTVTKLRR